MAKQNLVSILALFFIVYSLYQPVHSINLKQLPQFTRESKTIFELLYPTENQKSSQKLQNNGQTCITNEDQKYTVIDDKNPKYCSWQQTICKQVLSQLTRVSFDAQILSPGSFFRSQSQKNSAKSIISEYVSKNYKNPLSIRLSNGLNTVLSGITSPAYFKQKLNVFLAQKLPYLNEQPVEIAVAEQSKIEKMMETLGLSSSIYEKLGIARTKKDPITITKKVVIVLHQKFFTASMDMPAKVSLTGSSLAQFFFRSMPAQESQRIKNLVYDPEAPLQFISKTNYGRLLVLSLTENKATQNQVDRLLNCITLVNIEYACFSAVMGDIRLNPTLNYYIAGVDETLPLQENQNCSFCRHLVNWQRVFFPLNESSVQNLRPLSAQAANFRGQPYLQQQYRFFETQTCKKSVTIEIKLLGEGNTISVLYSRRSVYSQFAPNDQFKKQVKKHLFNATHPGTFQIGSQVGKEVFELKFIAKGKRISNGLKFFFLKNKPLYSIQVQFAMLINGEKKLGHIIGQSRSENQFKHLTIRVDPETFAGNVIFIDE